MTDPGAVVHVVGAEDGSSQLLHQIVLLIGAAGGGESANLFGAMFGNKRVKFSGYEFQCLIPGCCPIAIAFSD